jgi:hypothetical protein
MHRVATWIDLQTSKLADVPIDIQLQKKYISLCSEMRLCTSLSNDGENYTSMSMRSCSDAVLTAMSKGSLPSGNPEKMPAVCQSSRTAVTLQAADDGDGQEQSLMSLMSSRSHGL